MQTQQRLNAYIPIDRRYRAISGESLPTIANGSALFADFFGFTPLTEVLAKELGPQRGAEELSRRLNAAYGILIHEVHQYRGCVITLSGDAIICWFEGDRGERAVSCGFSLQRALADLEEVRTPEGQTFKLAIKVAIKSGQARRFLIGQPEIQKIDVLAGSLLDELATVESMTFKGEVVVGAEVKEYLGDQITIKETRTLPGGGEIFVLQSIVKVVDPRPWPDDLYLPLEKAREWVLPQLAALIEEGQAQFLAELRTTVPLFLSFTGIDYDHDEQADRKLDAYIQWVQNILAYYEGAIMQLTMGDKGSNLYITWGAPLSHENDSNRAVLAALKLLDIPPELSYIRNSKIGISMGQLRIGSIGSIHRHTYSAIGKETNIAARLMSLATANTILVTERIAESISHNLLLEELPEPVSLKGVSQPITIYKVLENRTRERAGTTGKSVEIITGRKEERQVLEAALKALKASGEKSIYIIEGDAGLGKSTLVGEMVEKAAALGIKTYFGSGDTIEKLSPYHPWRSVFSEALNLDGSPQKSDQQEARILSLLENISQNPDWAPLLSIVLPLQMADNHHTAGLIGRDRAEATRSLLTELIQNFALDTPLLILLEDMQWFDSSSWGLLEKIAQEVTRVMIVMTTRPIVDRLPAELSKIAELPQTERIKLAALRPEEIDVLVQHSLGAHTVPESISEFIHEKAAGNPFFGRELALALRDTGTITIKEGVCRLSSQGETLGQIHFPDTLKGVITSRIDQLRPQQQLSMKVASVIGRTFGARILNDIHPSRNDFTSLINELQELSKLELLQPDEAPQELLYLFKHAITQDVTYSLLLFAQRSVLHQTIAEWYEQKYAEDLAPYFPILAHHWSGAAESAADKVAVREKAIDYAYKAGEQALKNNALLEAIDHFSRGLYFLKQQPETPQTLARELGFQVFIAIPLTLTRGWAAPEVGQAYLRARDICRTLGESPQLFLALSGIFTYYLVRGQFDKAAEMAEINLKVAVEAQDEGLIVEAAQDQGAILLYSGDMHSAIPHFVKVKELYVPEKHHPHIYTFGKDPLAVALQHHSIVNWSIGYPDRALAFSDEALALLEQWPHPFSKAWVLASRCVTLHMRGEIEAMQNTAQQLIPLAAKHGFPNWLAQGFIYLGWTLARQGQTEQGVGQILEGMSIWRMTGAELITTVFLYLLTDAYMISGQLELAQQTIEQAFEQIDRTGERWWASAIHRQQGDIYLLKAGSDERKVESCFLRALEIARQQRTRSLELQAAVPLAGLWQKQGEPDKARELLNPIFQWFTEGHNTHDLKQARKLLNSLNS